jgi:hypothetical protein
MSSGGSLNFTWSGEISHAASTVTASTEKTMIIRLLTIFSNGPDKKKDKQYTPDSITIYPQDVVGNMVLSGVSVIASTGQLNRHRWHI